jgi:arylsulfatase A-like enzyme
LRSAALLLVLAGCGTPQEAPGRAPNVVLVFADDLGYGDLGCTGAKGYATPHLDRMAAEGVRFTNFYVAQAVCSASRAALLTGCYPNRVSILGALGPGSKTGLHPDEVTLAELLKARGYATACFGKWHLGDNPMFLPTRQGFDEYFGLPYSNDMWPFHPERPGGFPPLPLIDQEKVVETNPDQTKLTSSYTDRAVRFIEKNRDRPFFLYVPHSMPHVPLFAGPDFKGKTERGLFGDVIAEIDHSVGRILHTLRRLGLDERTLVVFTSDNGPWLSYGDHAGSAGPYREGKGTMFEGGVRVPAIFRWPGRIPAGKVCTKMAATIDIVSTVAGAPVGDGKNLWPLLTNPDGPSPRDEYYFYWGNELHAVRQGPWKLHFPHGYRSLDGPGGKGGVPAKYVQRQIGLALYNLEDDPGESADVAAKHPDVVERLKAVGEKAREDLGDSLQKRAGRNVRPAGRIG